jgi:transcriptional regulator with XRE-family HTH domain
MAIGKNLKEICKIKGITLKELAINSGVAYSTIKNITSRDPESVSFKTLNKLASALSCDPFEIEYNRTTGIQDFIDDMYPLFTNVLKLLGYTCHIDPNNNIFISLDHETFYPITEKEIEKIENDIKSYVNVQLTNIVIKKDNSKK